MFGFVLACLVFAPFLSAQSSYPFRFVLIGDSGSGSASQRRVADRMWDWMQKNPFNLVLMLGDNIYGSTELTQGGDPRFFHSKFDVVYRRFQERGVVFHAVIGNHDTQTNHGQGEIDDQKRFGILGKDAYYKFCSPDTFHDGGRPLADFFALNTELTGEKMTRQVAWLKNELDKSKALWKFIFLHHPLYTIRGQRAPAVALRHSIEDSLRRNRVQFILAGHNHMYVRMKPVEGMLEVISGGGGRHLAFPRMDPCAEISARRYHFAGVEVYPDKVRFTAIDQNGNVFDEKVVDNDFLKTVTPGCPIR